MTTFGEDKKNLLRAFNPDKTISFALRCVEADNSSDFIALMGRTYAIDDTMYEFWSPNTTKRYPAPTLSSVSRAYGLMTSISWLYVQLFSLAEYAGVREKFTKEQLKQQASLILSEYHYLRLSELMDFFRLFKLGKFGKFYGIADPMVVMEALKQFKVYRSKVIDRLEEIRKQEEAHAEREERKKEAITYKQYKQMVEASGGKVETLDMIFGSKAE